MTYSLHCTFIKFIFTYKLSNILCVINMLLVPLLTDCCCIDFHVRMNTLSHMYSLLWVNYFIDKSWSSTVIFLFNYPLRTRFKSANIINRAYKKLWGSGSNIIVFISRWMLDILQAFTFYYMTRTVWRRESKGMNLRHRIIWSIKNSTYVFIL